MSQAAQMGRVTDRQVLYIGSQPPHEHNYARKLLAMLARGDVELPASGDVAHVQIAHDSWCGALRGGRCDCEPDISVRGDCRNN